MHARLAPARTGLTAAFATFCAAVCACAPLACDAAEMTQADQTEKKLTAASDFAPYQENYALYNRMDNRGWAGRDEAALRVIYSFKYTVAGEHETPARARGFGVYGPGSTATELFVSYTGSFDFYLGTRDSGPVINRLSNPALNWRVPLARFADRAQGDNNMVLSLEHRSNGQVQDPNDPRVIERASRAYAEGDHVYFDAISRGSNFVGLAFDFIDAFRDKLDLRIKLRWHFDEEAAVNWGPLVNAGRRISDYDIVQLQASYQWKEWGWLDANWRVGRLGLKTDSWALGYQAPWRHFPLYIRYHQGPMNTLANYSQRQDSIGIGVRFARPFE